MVRVMINTIKLLTKKKSFIAMTIIVPAIVIVFLSFTFGYDMNYKVGIIDKDNSYISKNIIETINKIENIDVININKNNYEILLASHQIEIAVIIETNFGANLLSLDEDKVVIKSISNSDIKSILISIIESKVNNLSLIAKISNNDISKFKEYNEEYKDNSLLCNLNKVNEPRPSIENSIGIVIMMVFINGATIANFLIEDEAQNTKSRVLVSGINPFKYYMALLIVFYLLSAISSILYYMLCKILNLDFNMVNTNNFLLVMLLLNLVSISLNLCIVSFTRNRYVASTINILLVIPSCMMSGVFWDFQVMPKYLQKVGECLPQRWVYVCIENLQKYNSLNSIKQYIIAMVILSFTFFIISLITFKNTNQRI